MRSSSVRQFLAGGILAGTLALSGAGAAFAQQTTTTTTIAAHPAFIDAGTCDQLDPNPAAQLNDLLPVGTKVEDGEIKTDVTPEVRGVLTASPVFYSNSDELDLEWDTVLDTSHALVIHESQENIQTYLACGDIGGAIYDDDGNHLVIALHPANDSGYNGVAILSEDGDGKVDVEVYLTAPTTENTTPVATPQN